MSERLTAEDIEQWRAAIRNGAWFHPDVLKALQHMIHLHDTIKRLQTLQPEGVTMEELEAVDREIPELVFFGRRHIAAVCRGMLREGGK